MIAVIVYPQPSQILLYSMARLAIDVRGISAGANIQTLLDRWELTVVMVARLIFILVCYRSFLHYAMNPKV